MQMQMQIRRHRTLQGGIDFNSLLMDAASAYTGIPMGAMASGGSGAGAGGAAAMPSTSNTNANIVTPTFNTNISPSISPVFMQSQSGGNAAPQNASTQAAPVSQVAAPTVTTAIAPTATAPYSPLPAAAPQSPSYDPMNAGAGLPSSLYASPLSTTGATIVGGSLSSTLTNWMPYILLGLGGLVLIKAMRTRSA